MNKPRLSKYGRLLFYVNLVFAILLFLGYFLPYFSPEVFPRLAVLTFGMPIFIGINILFALYWLIRWKREAWLSGFVLILGLNYLMSFYKISSRKTISRPDDVSLMSYNVRNFNRFGWLPDDSIPYEIRDFVLGKSPDIVCFQEYFDKWDIHYHDYKYRYFSTNVIDTELAFFSRYPIIHKKSLHFPQSGNKAAYVDVVVHQDTLRIFNIHLQSHGIGNKFRSLSLRQNLRIFKKVARALQKQEEQVKIVREAIAASPYQVIVCGDTNNSVFSYTYRRLSENMQDAFKQAGHGMGRTFVLGIIPIRMDVMLLDERLKIHYFKTYTTGLSDHFPILVRFAP